MIDVQPGKSERANHAFLCTNIAWIFVSFFLQSHGRGREHGRLVTDKLLRESIPDEVRGGF